ncbi:glycine cleavage system protein GcvH [bacterium]|nr:glycine cleavage system protein GcvH [bacterium]
MNIPSDLHYTKDHEWVRVDGEEALVGITDYAQGELGDIVFIELPEVGTKVVSGETFGTIEAVKAAADMYSPITGEIIAVNGQLDDSPELINKDPYGEGWILRICISDVKEIETLLSADEYMKLIDESA